MEWSCRTARVYQSVILSPSPILVIPVGDRAVSSSALGQGSRHASPRSLYCWRRVGRSGKTLFVRCRRADVLYLDTSFDPLLHKPNQCSERKKFTRASWEPRWGIHGGLQGSIWKLPHLRCASKCQFSLSKPSGWRPPGLRTLVAKRDSAGCDVQWTAPLRALHTYWESSPLAVGGGSVSGVKVTGPSRPASVKGQSEASNGR